MLIRYKKVYKKIAMGLLSFMPNEKDLKKLQKTMNDYVMDQDRHLFLWKEEEGIIGLMGILEDDNQVQLQHISVNPSHRDQGFGKRMVHALIDLYPKTPIISHENTIAFIEKCNLKDSSEKENENNNLLILY
ncbi:GNAT family N-acetyltransferase [Neobacillus ginsengisoli]|uniref:Riboflavin biosynthesis RibT protein n=1 Tax=Neobacillus ginsengisoli TaxID=904295 RepID=A0ABT9XXQ0_9BACI|nr:GNAT family N-acetyltransferase [Neobacillus ginsengisoli]MDQ0200173.1 riboflavin biosynthesis RibT protein [Neobacillus ginsengisoli]